MKINLLKSLMLASALGIIPSGLAQTNLPTATGARITFAAPDFDFGKVDSGTPVKHDFIFTNTGDQVLEVTGVRPGCGCTTAGDWDKKVEPGKTGKIPIQFNSSGYGGPVHKTVFVTCNDSTRSNLTLNVQGTIWKVFDVSPMYAVFNVSPEEQTNQVQTVKIVNNDDQPVTLSDPISNNQAFKAELKTVREGKEFEIRVTANTTQISGSISGSITAKTSSPKMPEVSFTAFAMLQPLVTVNPPQFTLPAGPLPAEARYAVTIQNNSTNSLVLSEPVINLPGADIQLKEMQIGRVFNLSVNFPAGFQAQPGQAIEAVVKSSLSKVPLVKVPVIQPLPPPAVHSASAVTQPSPVAVSPAASQK
jgi:hypothetical protein